jgi:hypothetical protein
MLDSLKKAGYPFAKRDTGHWCWKIWEELHYRIEYIKTVVTTHSTYGEDKKQLITVSESDRERSQHLNPGPPSVWKDHIKNTYRKSNVVISMKV